MAQAKPEILAPVGSEESLYAAVNCGADAVYLGAGSFNARRNAQNFSLDRLAQAVSYCHARGVKVYLTLNTLVSDDEMDEALHLVAQICAMGVDGLILQDLGLTEAIKTCAPLMERHASTQLSVQTLPGIELLRDIGFCRAVVPRETSGKVLSEMTKKSPIELEVFIHGALCMCVSGQCLLSAVLGGRSGNRGLCAQPCRLPFAAPGGNGHDLSLKDLSLLPYLDEAPLSQVASWKIEGRMKRAEYVAAAVTACKNRQCQKTDRALEQDLQSVFSRSGFTDGYFENKIGREMFGIRRHEDVTAAAPVLGKLQKLATTDTRAIPVDFTLTCRKGQATVLTLTDGNHTLSVSGAVPEPAQKEQPEEVLTRALSKLGDTPFAVGKITVEREEGLFLRAADVNALRREGVEALLQKRGEVKEIPFDFDKLSPLPKHTAKGQKTYVQVWDASTLPENLPGVDLLILPLFTPKEILAQWAQKMPCAVSVPRGIFDTVLRVQKALADAKAVGITTAWAGNLDGARLIEEAGMDLFAGFGTNIFNSRALQAWQDLGAKGALLSAELKGRQGAHMGGTLPRGVFAYGRLPLMLTKNCPLQNGRTCKTCDRHGALTDRMGIQFPVRCENGCSTLFNSRPVWLADRLPQLTGFDFILLSFTTETPEEISKVLQAYQTGGAPAGEFTRGLFEKGVQ